MLRKAEPESNASAGGEDGRDTGGNGARSSATWWKANGFVYDETAGLYQSDAMQCQYDPATNLFKFSDGQVYYYDAACNQYTPPKCVLSFVGLR